MGGSFWVLAGPSDWLTMHSIRVTFFESLWKSRSSFWMGLRAVLRWIRLGSLLFKVYVRVVLVLGWAFGLACDEFDQGHFSSEFMGGSFWFLDGPSGWLGMNSIRDTFP